VSVGDLEIAVAEDAFGVTVTAVGEVDIVTSTQLKRAFDVLLARDPAPETIWADLTGIGFMDTSGVAVLLGTRARAIAAGSRLVVTSASPALQRLFDVTGIGRFLSEPA
jgi:anti-sigma B factor antagonist